MVKTYLLGRDRSGWAIDFERLHTEQFLLSLGHTLTRTPLTADVVHAVWWNRLLKLRYLPLRTKPIIAFITNDISAHREEFEKANPFVDLWIAPNRRTYDELVERNIEARYVPWYVDERLFRPREHPLELLKGDFELDYDELENKFVVGSFQRDSLGKDLTQPKWQKNPQLLVDILDELPAQDVVLLLAGPRRHWIIQACRERGIEYQFVGNEPRPRKDDWPHNVLGKRTISHLYNVLDLYIVSSESEGGPQAIQEAALSKTNIISTDVGCAPDILDEWCLYEGQDEGVKKVQALLEGKDVTDIVERNYRAALDTASFESMLSRWAEVYAEFEVG